MLSLAQTLGAAGKAASGGRAPAGSPRLPPARSPRSWSEWVLAAAQGRARRGPCCDVPAAAPVPPRPRFSTNCVCGAGSRGQRLGEDVGAGSAAVWGLLGGGGVPVPEPQPCAKSLWEGQSPIGARGEPLLPPAVTRPGDPQSQGVCGVGRWGWMLGGICPINPWGPGPGPPRGFMSPPATPSPGADPKPGPLPPSAPPAPRLPLDPALAPGRGRIRIRPPWGWGCQGAAAARSPAVPQPRPGEPRAVPPPGSAEVHFPRPPRAFYL